MLSQRTAASQGRISYIDGLRAVAVLMVIVHHAVSHFPALPASIPVLSIAHLLLEGSHGVDLFFVLSGFCLSYPILQQLRAAGSVDFNVYRYFAKRLVRIVPPYYLALALFSTTALAMVPFGLSDVVKQLLFLDRHTAFVNGSFWTLCVEFRWYFFFPIALALWIRAPRAFLWLAFAAVLASNFSTIRGAPDAAMALPFMLGIVAAHIEISRPKMARWAAGVIPIALLGAFFYEMFGATEAVFYYQINPGWQVAAFLTVVASARPALRAILSWRPLVFIGTASYSIYLVHEPVIVFVESHARLGALLAPAAAAVSLAAGVLFWLVWERMWMNGSQKDRAVAVMQRACSFVGVRLQIPENMRLQALSETPVPTITTSHIVAVGVRAS